MLFVQLFLKFVRCVYGSESFFQSVFDHENKVIFLYTHRLYLKT